MPKESYADRYGKFQLDRIMEAGEQSGPLLSGRTTKRPSINFPAIYSLPLPGQHLLSVA
jgi:hypothetical protein